MKADRKIQHVSKFQVSFASVGMKRYIFDKISNTQGLSEFVKQVTTTTGLYVNMFDPQKLSRTNSYLQLNATKINRSVKFFFLHSFFIWQLIDIWPNVAVHIKGSDTTTSGASGICSLHKELLWFEMHSLQKHPCLMNFFTFCHVTTTIFTVFQQNLHVLSH